MIRVDIGGGYRPLSLAMAAVPRIEENILIKEDDGQKILLIVKDVTWRFLPEMSGFVPFLDVEVIKFEEGQRKRTPVRGA